jgi:hypothetical protein
MPSPAKSYASSSSESDDGFSLAIPPDPSPFPQPKSEDKQNPAFDRLVLDKSTQDRNAEPLGWVFSKPREVVVSKTLYKLLRNWVSLYLS